MATAGERTIAVLAVLGICAVFLYRILRWIMSGPCTPDPWDLQTESPVDLDEAIPLCDQCLAPQQHNGWFCPECGATVGPYSNYLPFVYVFSQGEVLRAGTSGRLRRSPLITLGLVISSFVMFAVVAPFYWFRLFKTLHQSDEGSASATPGSDPGTPAASHPLR
jgi:hypothetical protein